MPWASVAALSFSWAAPFAAGPFAWLWEGEVLLLLPWCFICVPLGVILFGPISFLAVGGSGSLWSLALSTGLCRCERFRTLCRFEVDSGVACGAFSFDIIPRYLV